MTEISYRCIKTILKGEIALKSALEREMSVDQLSLKEPPGQPQSRYRVCAVTNPIWRRELRKGSMGIFTTALTN